MKWLWTAMTGLSIVAMLGCPSEFGKDGRLNKAARRDTQDLFIKRCSKQKIEEVCGNGKENSAACRECGGP
jgi:hypothetical protein